MNLRELEEIVLEKKNEFAYQMASDIERALAKPKRHLGVKKLIVQWIRHPITIVVSRRSSPFKGFAAFIEVQD